MNFVIIVYLIIGFVLLFTTDVYPEVLKEQFDDLIFSQFKKEKFIDKILGIVGIIFTAIIIALLILILPLMSLISFLNPPKTIKNDVDSNKKYADFQIEKLELAKKYEGIETLFTQLIKVEDHPFNFSTDQIIYFEGEYDTFLNDYFTKNYGRVCEMFDTKTEFSQVIKRKFIYIPYQTNALKLHFPNLENILNYYFPNLSELELKSYIGKLEHLTTSDFTKLILHGLNYNGEIYSGLFRTRNTVKFIGTDYYSFTYTKLEGLDDLDIEKKLFFYIDHIREFDPTKTNYEIAFKISEDVISDDEIISKLKKEGKSNEIADFKFDYEAHKIAEDIKAKIEQLKVSGYHELILSLVYQSLEGNIKLPTTSNEDIFSIKPRLSRIAIDKNYKVYLIDYNKIEIVMTPLPKALFILFLKHPEGILLKSISEYKQELLSIYEHISYRETRNEIFKSIDEVTNPSSNSINEKCSRIKEAFVKHFDESIACHYYVTGERGKEKRIIINRDLVIWDMNIEDINEPVPLTEKQKIDKENEVMMLINVGKESLNDRKYSLAIQYFTRVIELDKFNTHALFMRGVGHLQLGKYKEAEEDNTKALEILPNYGLCFHNRAEARFMMKNFDGALKDITYYLTKINNNSEDSYYLRGLIRSELGDIDNACQDWFNASHLGHDEAKTMLLKYPNIRI